MFSKELKRGSAELLILSLLEGRPRHGYQLGKLIESRSDGALSFRIASLYPMLCRMEERGWIKGRWIEKPGERRRRHYALTRAGKKALTDQREQWEAFVAAVSRVVAPAGTVRG